MHAHGGGAAQRHHTNQAMCQIVAGIALFAGQVVKHRHVIKQIEGRRAGERIGAHAYQIAFLEVFAHRCIFAGVGNAIRSGAQGHAHAALT